jgi:16S rRNA (cytidine1402-2'-O)-methyltransferase
METVLGNRQAQLFRELTKIHEECLEGSLSVLKEHVKDGVKGELVVIVQGAVPPLAEKPDTLEDLLFWYRDELQSSLKNAVRSISSDLDLPRSQVYKKALSIWQKYA